jgi:hypothetical protein
MPKLPLDPDVADTAPSGALLTVCDEEHIITYLRLLDANAEGADWPEVARIVLHLDPERETRSRPEGFRQPSITRQMDDGARLSVTCYAVGHPLKVSCDPFPVAIQDTRRPVIRASAAARCRSFQG